MIVYHMRTLYNTPYPVIAQQFDSEMYAPIIVKFIRKSSMYDGKYQCRL